MQSTTQNSCIEVSQPQNLYHINWNVMAKRIECPANLTRVTGCKLNSQGLPQADPTAVDQASASGKGLLVGLHDHHDAGLLPPDLRLARATVTGADSTLQAVLHLRRERQPAGGYHAAQDALVAVRSRGRREQPVSWMPSDGSPPGRT